MPIQQPKRRPAFKPIGILRSGPFGHGKTSVFANLNLTPMIDTFTVMVIFLLQSFSASGELMFIQKDMKLPDAEQTQLLNERGPVVTVLKNGILLEGKAIGNYEELMDETQAGVPELAEKLTAIRERDEKMFGASNPAEGFKGTVLVQSDKTTNFMFVRKVIFAINEAGWVHVQFAVTAIGTGAEGGEGAEGAPTE
jgi:biopolymer transport protein ExbD